MRLALVAVAALAVIGGGLRGTVDAGRVGVSGPDHVLLPGEGAAGAIASAAPVRLVAVWQRDGSMAAYRIRVYGLAADGAAAPVVTSTPAPEPTVVVTEPPVTYIPGYDDIPGIICWWEFQWPCDQALSIAWCESNYEWWQVNDESGTLGLFQMNPAYHTWRFLGGDWSDPWVNTRAAYSLWEEEGWDPWTCSPWGWHP